MNNNKNNMVVNSTEAASNTLLNEPVIHGIILRGLPKDVRKLNDFLEQSSLVVIYKRTTYGKLFITDQEE